ncbi:ssr2 [Candida margitis]|uniref:ssr2 n=1 Tax=Candida margitis TaxID=1775924 RepID=UPI00222760E2|nr:ssr2 [Candida margitis]KAI5969378.1 ssr2 [Candida margitis]
MSSVPNDEIKQVEQINEEEQSQDSRDVPAQAITDDEEYQGNDHTEPQPLTAERLDQKQVDEMQNFRSNSTQDVPPDLESESLTHLNAEEESSRGKHENNFGNRTNNSANIEQEDKGDDNNATEHPAQDSNSENDNSKEEKEIHEDKQEETRNPGITEIERQDNEDNLNHSKDQELQADAIVDRQLPSIPVEQTPRDDPFQDKEHFIEAVSNESGHDNANDVDIEGQEDKVAKESNPNVNMAEQAETASEGNNTGNHESAGDAEETASSEAPGANEEVEKRPSTNLSPTGGNEENGNQQVENNQSIQDNAMEVDNLNEFTSAEDRKEYYDEEINQELGEEVNLKYTQTDDPAFDADFNADEDMNDNFDSSFLIEDDADDASNVEDTERKDVSNSENSPVKQEPMVSLEGNQGSKPETTDAQVQPPSKDDNLQFVGASESDSNNTHIALEPIVKSKTTSLAGDEEEPEQIVEEELDDAEKSAPKVKQTHLIVIPSYASWFNMKKIHRIEKESLPEFFDSTHPSKSPKLYANYRNFMINSYRLNPNEFLTLTSCRRNLVGDVGTLMRVHRFLNKWGLINYQVKPQFKPGYAIEKLPNGSSVDLPYTGDFHVKFDTPRGLFPFDTSRIPPERVDVDKLKSLLQTDASSHASVEKNGVNKKRSLSEDDDIKPNELVAKKQNDGWSQDEVSKLVNAVKTYKNDWYQIAATVGNNKTPQQCVLKLLKIPLEDKFNPIKDDEESDIQLLKFASSYPINSVENPVLANLVFMTRLVDSEVAKAASEAAIKAMDATIRQKVIDVYGDKKDQAEEDKGNTDPSGSDPELHQDRYKGEAVHSDQNGHKQHNSAEGEAIATTFGIVGARSHLFANYEEREMHKISASIINHELSKVETKLAKIEELEKIYERERQNLARQQEENFVDRLALTKSTLEVIKKLEDASSYLEMKESGDNNEFDKDKFKELLSDARSLIYKPTKQQVEEVDTSSKDKPDFKKNESEESGADDYKPLSLTSPQNFTVWAP